MRVPYAAQQLIEQVQERHKRATAERVGEPDGLGVIRTVEFDKTSSKFLAKVLPHLDDPRIVGFDEKGGKVQVMFASNTSADQRDPFPLDDAETVADAG